MASTDLGFQERVDAATSHVRHGAAAAIDQAMRADGDPKKLPARLGCLSALGWLCGRLLHDALADGGRLYAVLCVVLESMRGGFAHAADDHSNRCDDPECRLPTKTKPAAVLLKELADKMRQESDDRNRLH